ncbi:lipopolysaccharide biosynthesis protein, partial [Methylobacterium oryzae CBMB20]
MPATPRWPGSSKIGDPADIESQILVIRSPRLLRLAIDDSLVAAVLAECRYAAAGGHPDRISEKKDAACTKLTTDRNALIEYLQKRYTVLSSGRSRIITIGYKSPLPETAQTMANGLINAFLDDQRETQASSRKAAADWLHTEISQLDASIRADETRIQTFRRRKGLLKGSTAPISAERLTSISQQLAAAETAKADAAARLSEIENRGARGAGRAPRRGPSRARPSCSPVKHALQRRQRAARQPEHPPGRQPSGHPGARDRAGGEPARADRAGDRERREGPAQVLRGLERPGQVAARPARDGEDGGCRRHGRRVVDRGHGAQRRRIKRTRYADLVKRAGELETERRILTGSTRLVSLAELPQEPVLAQGRAVPGGRGIVLAGVLA